MYICMCMRECVKIFTVQKNRGKKFHQRHSLAKLAKISVYIVFRNFIIYGAFNYSSVLRSGIARLSRWLGQK